LVGSKGPTSLDARSTVAQEQKAEDGAAIMDLLRTLGVE